ncbi:tRNA (adenine-N(1)-)-methyltransferase non-catalytic subunit trm6 like protein [Zymoseptoria brevis]|uniref:tRNA (adenine(58)-N(1))-methyltransferase non-catalytic subunit TRM6 n=1 Tax=Zymoseptoria brevis TaxID=1047168 RepID=A0A0F4GT90_9PEZI|nr:tRNA (adenine-N(1)-)-methyltransferase non-catalytic subunit trm6 like protein [Zymoseptoria brevis]
MSSLHSTILPNTYIFLRLPTEIFKLVEIKLNTIIDVGKLGSFPANLLLGRPYHYTYELLERRGGEPWQRLRIVSPAELNAEAGLDDATRAESRAEPGTTEGKVNGSLPEGYDLAAANQVLTKNNRLTIDDATRQGLTHEEIEELKKSAGGKEVIEKILANHAGLDEKTEYSKAKYLARKNKKYLKRFTVLPMDLGTLIDYIMVKEPARIMEIRMEGLGLVNAWSNAHFSGTDQVDAGTGQANGRYLVVDDTGGLVVAGIAERMDLLYPRLQDDAETAAPTQEETTELTNDTETDTNGEKTNGAVKSPKPVHRDFPIPATSNTITVLHAAVQPNVSILKHFGYDTSSPTLPTEETEHPLHTHLKPLSWLQLLHPEQDPTYTEPERASEEELASWKSGKRGSYFKKRRRWERCKAIVDETRAGGFESLVIASHMEFTTILKHTVPLIRGGGHVVIYSPTIEPLLVAADLYSKERRAAYIAHLTEGETPIEDNFPVDPRLLLGASVQTSRVREWQVLPGRTHPLMTSRGGAEGYVFTARKVIPLEGGVEARGKHFAKKRKIAVEESTPTTGGSDVEIVNVPAVTA